MTPAELVQRGEAFSQELGREYYLTHAGLKAEAEFAAIYARHAELTSDGALEAARAAGSPALYEWVVDLRVSRALVPFEERQLAWEQSATVEFNGRSVPYLRVPIEIANTDDRDERRAMDELRARTAAAGLNGLRRDRFAQERALLEGLIGQSYVEAWESLTDIDLDALAEAAAAFLERTADVYHESLEQVVRRRLGIPLADLARSDAARLFRHSHVDAAFPADRLIETAIRQMGEMQLDARQGGRVQFDVEERPGKQPRAFCVPVKVPEEVHLVIRPQGGHVDFRTFWHELGHAMHFAAIDPALPFAARWVGDNSVTEGFAMLWDHLTLDPGWLRRYTALAGTDVDVLVFELVVGELFLVRRYAAKINYELELYRGDGRDVAARYAERLTEATGFRFLEDDALLDVDPGFYSARYLRAWQFEAALAKHLVDSYDEDWYRNPRAGEFVAGLMARGQADPAHRVAADVMGTPLGFEQVAARVEESLR